MKNYKKQKGGVITTKSTAKGNLDPEKVGRVFKSEELKKKETELKDVQRKIQELGVTYNEVTVPSGEAKRNRFAINKELVGKLATAYNNMHEHVEEQVEEQERVASAAELITQIEELHNKIGDDDDIKKLSNRQMKALKLKTDIEHTVTEIDLIKPILNDAKTAKKNKKDYTKATDKKKQDVKKHEKAVVEPAELERLQKALAELEGKEDKKKEYDKQKKSFDTKKANSDAAKKAIVKLNQEFNTNWGNWKTDDDAKKNKFIEEHLKSNQMMQGEAKNALTYLEVIEYALKDYKKSAESWKKTRKDKKLRWKTIEKESEDVSAKITAESISKKEEYDKNFATETAKKEKLEKEIEALTKKEDEKLSAETDKIAEGLKTGEFEGLEGNIKQQEGVVKTSQEKTKMAKKEEEKLKKKLKKTKDGTFLGFSKKQSEKRKADAVGAVQGELDAASAARLSKETEEKDAKKSLDATNRWKTGLKGVGSILHTKIKSSLIVPHVHDNDIQTRWRMMYNDTEDGKTDKQIDGENIKDKFKTFLKDSTDSFNVLTDQPYIYDPEGPYARTTDDKQSNMKDNKAIFYNYYLKKTIKSPDGKEISLVEMISQRMARYINYVMGHKGSEDDTRKLHRQTIALLNKKIQKLSVPTHLPITIGVKSKFRNYLNEKIQALNFLETLFKYTAPSFPQGDLQRYTDLMETSIDDQPLFDIFCTYLGKCYDINPSQKLLELETQYTNIITTDDNDIKRGLSEMNLGNNKPCEPPVDDYGELYLRVGKGLELYSKEVLDGEEEEKRKVIEALKKYEKNSKETEEIQKQTKGLLQKLEGKINEIKKEKYFIDGLKEKLEKLKLETHGMGVLAKEQEMKNNTKGRAELAAATDLLNKKKLASAVELQNHQAAQKKKDKEIENLLKREEELKAQMKSQQEAVNKCGDDSVEEKRQLQEALDKKGEELAQAKAATEAAKQDKTSIDDALTETEKTVADQEAESEDLSRKEEKLNAARKELIESTKPDKEEKDGDEEDDEFDFGGVIDEMANRPEKDVEIDFGNNKTLVLMARLDKYGNVQIEHQTMGKGSGIEKEISDYGMGNLEAL